MIRVLGLRENLDHRLQNLAHVLTHVFQLVGRGHAGRQKFSGDAARASRGGKRYGRLFVGAHRHFERTAADVQHQHIIDIDPHIIVAHEFKHHGIIVHGTAAGHIKIKGNGHTKPQIHRPLRQHIAAAHQKNERKRQKRKKIIAAAACSAAAIAVAFAVSHPLLWYENWTTADEQQHFVTSHEIAIEMLETAVADPMLPTDETVEVQSIAALDALIGRKTGIPEMVNGQWELQHRYVNFTRSGISISLMYVNAADAQQTIVGVINLISNPQYMMLSFEQSYEGTIQQFDGLNFYITENINKPVALWQGDDKLLLFSGRTSQEEVTSLLRTIIREIGE